MKADSKNLKQAVFAGGCFWCVEHAFDHIPGVVKTISGYVGGQEANPTYEEVSSGSTGHTEAVQVHYDSNQATYQDLLEVFWRNIDPTQVDGQFVDKGKQYRTAIFYQDVEEKQSAEDSKKQLEESGKFDKPIVTEITQLAEFYPAEDYHQDYYLKNPVRYKTYRFFSGRDQFIDRTWGKGN